LPRTISAYQHNPLLWRRHSFFRSDFLESKKIMDTLIQQIINGLVLGSMYALVALGYTMVYGVLNLINFAHGDVLMVGAMVGITILKIVQTVAPDLPGAVKLIIAIIGAIPVCIAVNVLIERIAYRRLRNAPRLAPLITAIGVSILLQTFAMMIWGRNPITFPQVMPPESLHVFGALISPTQVMLLILAALAMIGLLLLVEKTKMGRAMRATAENPRVAGLMGVDSNKVVVLTFAIGAALAAVAGVMWGATYASAQFAMGFLPGLKAFSAAVLGGIGNIYGAMLGGILLGLIESLGAGYIGDLTGNFLGSQYQDIFAFVVLIIVLTLRPSGIMGERVADRA
jgi:branched-chain amino acid transport system permease protein